MEPLHYLLMKANSAFSRNIMWGAGQMGLTSGQPKILEFLLETEEADQKTIAEHCEIEQATAGSILLRMESAGLIIRKQHAGNRRSLYVSLTEKGKEAASGMEAVFQETDDLAASALTAEELDQLKRSLKKISNAVSDKHHERKNLK